MSTKAITALVYTKELFTVRELKTDPLYTHMTQVLGFSLFTLM